MALSKKKQKTQTTQTSQNTATTTPNVPDWISQPAQNIAGGINSMIGAGPSAYAPVTNDLQKKAWEGAENLTGYGGTDFSGAESAINEIGPIAGESVLSGLENYYNPFKDQVLNPVLNDYDFESGKVRSAQAADAARNGAAFRGSRYGIQEASTEGELLRGRQATEGGLLKDMFNTATGLSAGDADRRQGAAVASSNAAAERARLQQSLAQQRSNEGLALSADERARLAVQAGFGQNKYETENAQRQYPIEYTRNMEGLLQGLNPALYTGSTATGSSSGTGTSNTTSSESLGSWFGNFLTATAGAGMKAAMGGA